MLQIATSEDFRDELIALEHQIDLLQLRAADLAFRLERSTHWDDEGFGGAIDWLRFNCHLTSTVAADRINVGRHRAHMPESIQAMEAGEIGYAHLKVMARTADAVGDLFDETRLLPLATDNTPGKFHYKCMHYRHSVDAEKYAAEQSDQSMNHYLSLTTVESGHLLIAGVLDPVGGAVVRGALEHLAQKSGAHDDRNLPQRNADALVELASGTEPANLQITASIETLKDLAGSPAGEMEFSLPISSAAVRRIACDCSVTRVLLDQESLVVDVGRSKRIVGTATRRALRIRDQHCRWPGCERPASRCDGHHVVHWIHGGETNLDNLALLCKRHHRMVHEGGWQLIKTDEGRLTTLPPTITFGSSRGPD